MKKLLLLTLLVCLNANAATILEPMVGYTRISMANDNSSEFIMSGFVVGGKVGFQRDQSTYGLRALFGPSLDAKADPSNDVVDAIIDISDFSYSQIGLFSQSSINEKVNFFFGFDFAYKITLEALGQKDESDNYNLYAGMSFKVSENFLINGEVGYLIPEESEDKADLPLSMVVSISSPIPF